MINDIMPFYFPSEKLIVKSDDCYLYDSDGKRYIDFESGVWCANIGHSNSRIVDLLGAQARRVMHHGYWFRNQYAEELSVKIQELTGLENGASVFLSSGSEAVNLSIVLAKYITGRKKVLKIDNSYLSAYGYGQISESNVDLISVKFNDLNAVDDIDFSEIAAFVVETGGASIDMVRFPDKDFITKLIEKALKNECLIIAEEVTTGIGRTGKWFGFLHYGFTPDIVVTGKALGNGFPISAVTVNSKIKDRFEKAPFRYAQSHQNDPLGCVIGLEVIKVIQENDLIEKSLMMGDLFKNSLEFLMEKHRDKVKEVRSRGLMLAIEFNNSYNGEELCRRLFESGFVFGFKSNTFRFLPPLTIQRHDIDSLIGKMDELLIK